MLKSLYEVNRKSKKWWHRILFYFVDLSLVNAFILFKKNNDSEAQLTLKEFRLAVALGLVGAEQSTVKKGRPSTEMNHFKHTVPMEIRFDACAHMPVHGNPRRCAFCSSRAEPHKSRWHCSRYTRIFFFNLPAYYFFLGATLDYVYPIKKNVFYYIIKSN